MKLTLICVLVILSLAYTTMALPSAYPALYSIEKFDKDVSDYEYRNSRLRRAYYYDDDEYYRYYPYEYETYNRRSAQPIRRQDSDVDPDSTYKYQPILRYKDTHAKHKKLFVPNLWG